jgi:hypothetical protein
LTLDQDRFCDPWFDISSSASVVTAFTYQLTDPVITSPLLADFTENGEVCTDPPFKFVFSPSLLALTGDASAETLSIYYDISNDEAGSHTVTATVDVMDSTSTVVLGTIDYSLTIDILASADLIVVPPPEDDLEAPTEEEAETLLGLISGGFEEGQEEEEEEETIDQMANPYFVTESLHISIQLNSG